MNIESLQDDTSKWLYKRRLEEHIRNNIIKETDNVEDSWDKLKRHILNASQEALGKRPTLLVELERCGFHVPVLLFHETKDDVNKISMACLVFDIQGDFENIAFLDIPRISGVL